jgi:hypothetical protein
MSPQSSIAVYGERDGLSRSTLDDLYTHDIGCDLSSSTVLDRSPIHAAKHPAIALGFHGVLPRGRAPLAKVGQLHKSSGVQPPPPFNASRAASMALRSAVSSRMASMAFF